RKSRRSLVDRLIIICFSHIGRSVIIEKHHNNHYKYPKKLLLLGKKFVLEIGNRYVPKRKLILSPLYLGNHFVPKKRKSSFTGSHKLKKGRETRYYILLQQY